MRRLTVALVVAAVLLPLPAIAAARTTLTITADLADGAKPYKWTLTCDPVGGTHPNKKAACALLAKQSTKVFVPVPNDAACTMIFGGPEQVTVAGSVRGKKVKAIFQRSNGCEIARYDKAAPLFTIPGTFVLRGYVTLDEQPADATVLFLNAPKQAKGTATAGVFAIRLTPGTWLGSANIGRSCAAVTVGIPYLEAAPPTIACRSTSS